MEFVWRSDAAFLKCTKIRVVLREYFTFSTYMEFVKWAKKSPVIGLKKYLGEYKVVYMDSGWS